jgi:hypothetical protein
MSESPSRASSIPEPKKPEKPDPAKTTRFRPIRRGKFPSKDDFLTDEEVRDRELAKVNALKVETNVKARRLAIMQEHRSMMELANAITRNPKGARHAA